MGEEIAALAEETIKNFLRMEKWIFDSPDQAGETYRQFIKDMYQQNKLIKGELTVLGKPVNLGNISCPLVLLAGQRDDITLIPQVHNTEDYVSTPKENIFKAIIPRAGHISVFMGQRALQHEWPDALEFLRNHRPHHGRPRHHQPRRGRHR